ncbi:relaxase/mobilization nuclease domain-containing protein [Yoonia sp. MH D7]
MIPTVIHRQRDALRTRLADISKLVGYLCIKAVDVETRNLLADWRDADWQMWATANGSRYCTTLTHHFILSWPETEHPTPAQAIVAAKWAITALGADDYQAVIAVHMDRANTHVHVALNKIHPVTFKAISVSHDYAKLERACREIELSHGWSQDQGRFDAVMIETPDGPKIEMRPKPQEHWDAKQARRAKGRGATQGDLNHERQTGMIPLIDALSQPWKARVKSAMDDAVSWQTMHMALMGLGLAYSKSGSGGRLAIRGSDQYLSPSQLGKRYAWKALDRRFDKWTTAAPEGADAAATAWLDLPNEVSGTAGLNLSSSARSPLSSRRLVATTYIAITNDEDAAREIEKLSLYHPQPTMVLRSGDVIRDDGNSIKTTVSKSYAAQVRLIIAMAKGCITVAVKGTSDFVKFLGAAALRAGLTLKGEKRIAESKVSADEIIAPVLRPKIGDQAAQAVAQRLRGETLRLGGQLTGWPGLNRRPGNRRNATHCGL